MAFPIATENIETRHYINGSFEKSSDNATFEVHSPFNHKKVADVYEATIEDTNKAVAAAKAAFPAWSTMPVEARGALLKKLAALIREATPELAQLEAMSMGRPVSTYFDAFVAAMDFEHYAEAGYEVQGKSSTSTPRIMSITLRQPLGPIAAIIPWNVPVCMFSMKVAPALIAGCTVVLKSSEKAPLTSLKMAKLFHQAGFPPGVINVLSGHGTPAGTILSAHPDIKLVSFTGSTGTGRKIQLEAAKSNLKRVVLELGGKSPAIIFDDADIERAAAECAYGVSLLSGQACIANSRIYVQDAVADRFKKAFTTVFTGIKKGDPLLPETAQGPQADKIQHDRIKTYLKSAKAGKGTIAEGGTPSQINGTGFFIDATVLHDVPEDEKCMKEEIFGPIVAINTFKMEAEVIAKANDTDYGLYAAVYTKDIDRAMRFAKALDSGTVCVNCTTPTHPNDAPFGGYKASGQGREGYGWSLENYFETKAVLIKIAEL